VVDFVLVVAVLVPLFLGILQVAWCSTSATP
jgi:hypothetical protein